MENPSCCNSLQDVSEGSQGFPDSGSMGVVVKTCNRVRKSLKGGKDRIKE